MGLATGTKLGPYEIQSPLGAGGMGEVYRARDTRLERDVTVKVLPTNLSSDSSLRQRLDREAKAVSKLSEAAVRISDERLQFGKQEMWHARLVWRL